ncbi:uncharacterized protein LOC119600860 [Lucilia sericata]|uniref:uncharacterized protein LOC119600860 n=1 Tax=Lucilia sericata TaxID=13632 RepID=UPI0018A85DFD|nr:uncharacterized protein LOC119600860 [Lucilia sericata]
MVSTVSWTSFAVPSTLVNVGSEAVCMLCDNNLCFTDLKTKSISYYKAESPQLGLSISAMTGHNKFSLVAFSEVVLRPSVHIIQYPDFTKYAVFSTQKIISFVDIRFNEYDLLIAISGYPYYTLCIWNFRTGQLLVQHDTLKESLPKSLLCSFHHIPDIVQFSKWNREILIWELCYSSTGVDLHEVSKIELSKEFTLSDINSMCYGEDNNLYVVDNFANVSMVEVAQFHLKPQWSVTDPLEMSTQFKSFYLECHKQGLLVYSNEIVYYLRKKLSKWHCEWKLSHNIMPQKGLRKCISNSNGEIYASAAIGNLYHIEATEEVKLNPVNVYHENSIDFVLLKGVKEECLIQLTTDHAIKALQMSRYAEYSKFVVPFANTLVAHNLGPFIMVGTSRGKIHFLNYSNIKEPFQLSSIDTHQGYAIGSLQLMDQLAVYRTIYYDFYLLKTDFTHNSFYEIGPFQHISENDGICQYFLGENNRIFMFINRDSQIKLPHCNTLSCYHWLPESKKLNILEYQLPHTYRDVGEVTVPTKNIVEFFAIRLESNVMDYLQYKTDTNVLVLVHSIQTHHLSSINGIISSRNLLTWGVDGTYIHYRSHKKSPKPYGICQILQIKYRPRVVQKVLDCFNVKYLVYMYSLGGIKVMRVASTGIPTIENQFDEDTPLIVEPHLSSTQTINQVTAEVVIEHSEEEKQKRKKLLQNIRELGKEVTDLIDYDMSVTGKSQGIFKKFCLNHKWLRQLIKEAEKLCEAERRSLEAAIEDQSRIRDWFYFIIMSTNSGISFKIRAIFSKFSLENYGLRKRNDKFALLYELYRFYDLESLEAEETQEEIEGKDTKEEVETKELKAKKHLNYFEVTGSSSYEHIMCEELAMQDVNIVTANQMYNQDAKIRILLTDRLKYDFNKKFEEIRQIKSELMEAILTTNNTLMQIYENMNCMLRLLGREQFKPPQLSKPEWQKDEFVKSIMEVDDSEIKAVNRRKKKAEVEIAKRGRLLLWSVEFWVHALITMMDGVLEKLWEEEIKKNIPIPEFLSKKEPAEYTLEDQKALREYEEKCRLLEEDRKKYLSILKENESQINELKTGYILKLNENVSEMMILKLKYDFAIKHVRLRNLNTKIMNFKKLQWLQRINMLREDIDLITEYVHKYSKLSEFWAKSVEDLRLKVDSLLLKEKSVERLFKGQFLNSIPQHLGPEMTKLFKKRPKSLPKLLHSTLICKELSLRVNTKSQPKFNFPLPKDVYEYLDGLNSLDETGNIPVSLESKHWEQFVKLRRQKVEMELKVRAVNLQLADSCSGMNSYGRELSNLKSIKVEALKRLHEAQEEYLKLVQNQTLELRLTMGQVELNIMGSLKNLQNCVLMHEDDVNDINALILKAGQMKIKAMQRVAFFRRQVIYKEWEHKVVGANIEYLKNMLYVIGKCKVSIEFLNILRNWNKVKAEKQKLLNSEGLLEKVAEEKLTGFRRQLVRLTEKISVVRQQIDEKKLANKRINRQIEDLKVAVSFAHTNRDFMIEEKKRREQNEKMEKIKRHSNLIETVRRDYVHIMELKTILELQRLRTYPTLGPNPSHCLP